MSFVDFRKNDWFTKASGSWHRLKSVKWIGAIVALAILWEFWLLRGGSSTSIRTPRFLKAVRSLDAGENVQFRDFTYTHEHPKDPGAYVTDQDLELVAGAKFRLPIREGDWVSKAAIRRVGFSESIPKGFRAYAVEAEANLPLRSGDLIDVFRGATDRRSAAVLVEGLRVLRPASENSPLYVAATSSDIEVMENAADHGKLGVALRNPAEGEQPRRRKTPRLRKRRIDVMVEGE